ncbi:MAG: heme exporter protein CcmB [Pseudomonadota bacterium]
MSAFAAVFRRDLALAWHARGDLVNPLGFYLMVVALFPLGMSPEPALLAQIGPGLVWVAALLAVLLSLESLFRADRDDGSLEQMLMSPQPLPLLVLARVAAHVLTVGLPLVIVTPVLAVMLGIDGDARVALLGSLLLGVPVLCMVGAIGAALTAGIARGGMLVALIVLPLYVPVLVFGAGAAWSAAIGMPYAGQLAVLGALLALSTALAPFAIAGALRIGGSQ